MAAAGEMNVNERLDQLATLETSAQEGPARFPPLPADWLPRDILVQSTSEHYEAHEGSLRRRLASRAEGESPWRPTRWSSGCWG